MNNSSDSFRAITALYFLKQQQFISSTLSAAEAAIRDGTAHTSGMNSAPRPRWTMFALLLAAASARAAHSAPAPAAAPEPPPPKGLERMLRFDCAKLENDLAEDVAAGRFTKPDLNNAALVISALELKDCHYVKDGPVIHALEAGASVTNEYIAESGRYAEYCSIFDLAEYVPGQGSEIDKMATFRKTYCSPAPPSTWNDADTRVVQLRAQRLPELDQLHARFDAALQAQRLYSPAGDNVLELGLLGRERGFGKIREYYVSVLRELLPRVVAGAEQALAAGDRAEFERLLALLERADPQLPDIERLRRKAGLPR
jgi:hypothetical protein